MKETLDISFAREENKPYGVDEKVDVTKGTLLLKSPAEGDSLAMQQGQERGGQCAKHWTD